MCTGMPAGCSNRLTDNKYFTSFLLFRRTYRFCRVEVSLLTEPLPGPAAKIAGTQRIYQENMNNE